MLVSAVSTAVVAGLVGYVVAPPNRVLDVRLRSSHLIAAEENDSIVYGKVHDGSGDGIGGVTVQVERQPKWSTTSAPDGTFRLATEAGRREIEFRCVCAGGERSGSITLELRPRHAYELDVRVQDERGFVVFPVSGY